jgi:hypothetical protein
MFPRSTKGISEGFFRPADAAFIAHAREDIPALLAEVERLRRELADRDRVRLDFGENPTGRGE